MAIIFDFVILLMIGVSALISVMRGATREFLMIVPWAISILAGLLWYDSLGFERPHNFIDSLLVPIFDEEISSIIGTIGVFIIVLTATSVLVKKIMILLLFSAHIGAIDRVLGFVFGVARGVVIILFLTLVFDALIGNDAPLWVYESYSYGHMLFNANSMVNWLKEFITEGPLYDYQLQHDVIDDLKEKHKNTIEDSS